MRIRCLILLALGGLQLFSQSPEKTDQAAPVFPKLRGVRAGQTETNPTDALVYVWIPPGSFVMGCSPGDRDCARDERPNVQVTLGAGFWIGQTPVTQEAYQRVTGRSPGYFKGAAFPADSMSWDEAQSYCQATGMRLPTEAEWEYAARAGSPANRYGDLDQIAWYGINSGDRTHDTMQKRPNAWGLYDMLGNVWEWTADDFLPYPGYAAGPFKELAESAFGSHKVLRGGCWATRSRMLRNTWRQFFPPDRRDVWAGFRTCAV